jgi:hypothetical protein
MKQKPGEIIIDQNMQREARIRRARRRPTRKLTRPTHNGNIFRGIFARSAAVAKLEGLINRLAPPNIWSQVKPTNVGREVPMDT